MNDDQIAKEMGDRIKRRREHLEKSQVEVAERMGIGRSNLSQIEGGAVKISAIQVLKLAEILRVSPAYFYDDILAARADEDEVVSLWREIPDPLRRLARATLQAFAAERRPEDE